MKTFVVFQFGHFDAVGPSRSTPCFWRYPSRGEALISFQRLRHAKRSWIPACAGMTGRCMCRLEPKSLWRGSWVGVGERASGSDLIAASACCATICACFMPEMLVQQARPAMKNQLSLPRCSHRPQAGEGTEASLARLRERGRGRGPAQARNSKPLQAPRLSPEKVSVNNC